MRRHTLVGCAESIRVQAYLDGELDALAAVEIERHVDRCVECRAELTELEQLRKLLRSGAAHSGAPAALARRIVGTLDAEDAAGTAPMRARSGLSRSRSWNTGAFWAGVASALGAAAAAAVITLAVLSSQSSNTLLESLVANHLSALSSDHLIAVASSDRHTVKPWFAAHADVSPAVADFAADGYRLVGGRAAPVLDQRAAVLVFQHGAHAIDVFAWAGEGGLPHDVTRRGYHLAFWQVGDVRYCAVSDTAWEELRPLEGLLRALAEREH